MAKERVVNRVAVIEDDEEGAGVDRVEALARGLMVIRCFGRGREALTLTQVAQMTSTSRAVARRMLHTLVDLSYIKREEKHFQLTPKIMELGFSYLYSLPWWEVASPHIRAISDQLGETCVAGVLSDREVVMVARHAGPRFMAINMPMGARLPFYATAMGRVLASTLPVEERERYLEEASLQQRTPYTITSRDDLRAAIEQAARDGFSIVSEEFELGLRAIAVPLLDSEGKTLASLAVSVYAARASESDLKRDALPLLRAAAADIREALPRMSSITRAQSIRLGG